MSSIPPHYSEQYVNQRYNKALHIVQHLPASSSFQPSKEQKLELYSLYKQVSHGNIDTQRPGMFDVVGRAKWDAWKRLQGLSTLESKHRYVETLLKVCTEASRKPAAKPQMQQIIQTFAMLRPTTDSGDDDGTDDMESSEAEDHNDGETSESMDDEEEAYLMDIKNSVPAMTPSKSVSTLGSQASDSYHSLRSPVLRSPTSASTSKRAKRRSWHSTQQQQEAQRHQRSIRRAPSIESTQSMMTAPTSNSRRMSRSSSTTINHHHPLHLPLNSAASMRPPSNMSHRSDQARGSLLSMSNLQQRPPSYYEDHFDDSVNPWAATAQDASSNGYRRHSMAQEYSSDDSIDEERKQSYLYTTSPSQHRRASRPVLSSGTSHYQRQRQHDSSLRSPLFEVRSNASSVTATGVTPRQQSNDSSSQQPASREQEQGQEQQHISYTTSHAENRLLTERQYTSVIALGPATKRALETLQSEIIALNERINGLRQELIDRDQRDMTIMDKKKSKNRKNKNSVKLPGRSTARKGDEDGEVEEVWDAWEWVLKAALKHTTVNLMTILLILFLLYKRGNPMAYTIFGLLYKQLYRLKVGLLNK